mmetsp:Transcript_6402/g.39964  ORF Transcript_6402/g.39964 Transcript_6402/m.39964 type:complete len:399 (+) Transcript_6402:2103-3299(+)
MHRSFPTFLRALEHVFGHVLDLLVGESFPKGALKLPLASFAVSRHPACARVDEIVQFLDGIQPVLFQVAKLQRLVGFDDVSTSGVTSGALQCEQLVRVCGPCCRLHPPHPDERTDRSCCPRTVRRRSSSTGVGAVSFVGSAPYVLLRVSGLDGTRRSVLVPSPLPHVFVPWMDATRGFSIGPHVPVVPSCTGHGPRRACFVRVRDATPTRTAGTRSNASPPAFPFLSFSRAMVTPPSTDGSNRTPSKGRRTSFLLGLQDTPGRPTLRPTHAKHGGEGERDTSGRTFHERLCVSLPTFDTLGVDPSTTHRTKGQQHGSFHVPSTTTQRHRRKNTTRSISTRPTSTRTTRVEWRWGVRFQPIRIATDATQSARNDERNLDGTVPPHVTKVTNVHKPVIQT